jgi:predicted TIM-barrel fold metal-dependent hydrolase
LITDAHTHLYDASHISDEFLAGLGGKFDVSAVREAPPEAHAEAIMSDVDRAIVLAFQAPACGFSVPNDYVADYVRTDPARLVGFGSVDPHDLHALDELDRIMELGLKGLKMGPIYQNVDPLSTPFLRICARAEQLGLPLLIHQGGTFLGPLLHSRPILLDEIAARFPELTIQIAHVGHPWIEETIVVIRKHRNLYADVSVLHGRPWQLYNALRCAIEYGVADKLLLGSDWPIVPTAAIIDALREVPKLAGSASLPEVPSEVVEGIIHRDPFALLGIATPA